MKIMYIKCGRGSKQITRYHTLPPKKVMKLQGFFPPCLYILLALHRSSVHEMLFYKCFIMKTFCCWGNSFENILHLVHAKKIKLVWMKAESKFKAQAATPHFYPVYRFPFATKGYSLQINPFLLNPLLIKITILLNFIILLTLN